MDSKRLLFYLGTSLIIKVTRVDKDGVQTHPLDMYWDSLGLSFLSLFQILVYDDTFALIRETKDESVAYSMVLLAFIVVGAFTVLNMLIGVICEIVSTTKKEEEEKMLMQKVEELFSEMDSDGSGTISRDEFEKQSGLLEKLGLDQSTIKLAFELIDDDRSGTLEMQEFLHMVYRLLNPPTTQDLLCIKRNLAKLCDALGCDVFDAPPPMALKKGNRRGSVRRASSAYEGSPKDGSASTRIQAFGESSSMPDMRNVSDSNPVGKKTTSNVEAYSIFLNSKNCGLEVQLIQNIKYKSMNTNTIIIEKKIFDGECRGEDKEHDTGRLQRYHPHKRSLFE